MQPSLKTELPSSGAIWWASICPPDQAVNRTLLCLSHVGGTSQDHSCRPKKYREDQPRFSPTLRGETGSFGALRQRPRQNKLNWVLRPRWDLNPPPVSGGVHQDCANLRPGSSPSHGAGTSFTPRAYVRIVGSTLSRRTSSVSDARMRWEGWACPTCKSPIRLIVQAISFFNAVRRRVGSLVMLGRVSQARRQ